MANGVNKCIFLGNLGNDPELRYTSNGGTAVCQFSIAVNESWTDKEGEKREKVEWIRIVAWSKLGELCSQYLSKGRQVYVEGKMQTREWEDKEGVKHWTTEIRADQVVFLGQGQDSGDRQQSRGNSGGGKQGNRQQGNKQQQGGNRNQRRDEGNNSNWPTDAGDPNDDSNW